MEKKTRQSRKQKQIIERNEMIKEFRREYRRQVELEAKRLEISVQNLEQVGIRSKQDENEYIRRKLDDWEIQSFVPSGLYQEINEVNAVHQEKFVEALRNSSPAIIEELKSLIENFNVLFGELSSDEEFSQKLNIIFSLQISPYTALDSFPFTKSTSNIKNYFSWERYKVPFFWAKHFFDSEKSNNKKPVFVPDVVQVWLNELDELNDTSIEQPKDFASTFKEEITKSLEEIAPNKSLIWENFLTLQCGIYDWIDRNNLEKDFLLEIAYIFLFQFSQEKNLEVNKLRIWRRKSATRLSGHKFEFESKGWVASRERAEDYKKRLKEEFKTALDNYIFDTSNSLQLRNKLHITKPKDLDFESIYWLLAWNEGSTYSQIGKCFRRSTDAVKSGLKKLTNFGLPKRVDTPGKKKDRDLTVSEKRTQQIKKAFIDFSNREGNK